jgi:TPR repeat protein
MKINLINKLSLLFISAPLLLSACGNDEHVNRCISKGVKESECIAANIGSNDIKLTLANKFLYGRDIPSDVQEAAFWMQKAVDNGDAEAEYALAELYEQGIGVESDKNKALELYTKSAEQGNPKAFLKLANFYYSGQLVEKDYLVAFEWYKKAHLLGNRDATSMLAHMYEYGEGVNIDYIKAYDLYRQAAINGDAYCQYKTGYILLNSGVIEPNVEEAFKWLLNAADQNIKQAQTEVAKLILSKDKLDLSEKKIAIEWLEKASANKEAEATYLLGEFHLKGLSGIFNVDEKKGIELLQKSADLNFVPAMNRLGRLYLHGEHVIKDINNAYKWFNKAASFDSSEAQYTLGMIYLSEYNRKSNKLTPAISWFELAADNKNVEAMIELAKIYENGKGVKKDMKMAYRWYSKAYSYDNSNYMALYKISRALETGTSGFKDKKTAFEYYKTGAQKGYAPSQAKLSEFYLHRIGGVRNYIEAYAWNYVASTCMSKYKKLNNKYFGYLSASDKKIAREKAREYSNDYGCIPEGTSLNDKNKKNISKRK